MKRQRNIKSKETQKEKETTEKDSSCNQGRSCKMELLPKHEQKCVLCNRGWIFGTCLIGIYGLSFF